MNVTSLFRDTASQLAIGAGKVINNIVDFFSSLRADITGLFNSNTSFRQAATDLSLINHNDPKKNSLGTLNDFLDGKFKIDNIEEYICEKTDDSEGIIYEKIDDLEENIYEEIKDRGEHIYEEIKDRGEHIYEKMKDEEEHIYDVLNEYFLDLVIKLPESRNENKSSAIEDEYSVVVDSIEKSSENIYSEPYEATLSDKNKYNTI